MSDEDVVYMYAPDRGRLTNAFYDKPRDGMLQTPREVAESFCALYAEILAAPRVELTDS